MSNDYFESSGIPATRSPGASSPIRAEFTDIELGFDKMPTLTGNANKPVVVNASATALTTVAALGPAQGGTGASTVFTAGSVIFAGASGVYSQNNTNLFWDNTNLGLGMGVTTLIGYKIRIHGALAGGSVPVGVGVTGEVPAAAGGGVSYQSLPTYNAALPFVLNYTHYQASQGAVGGTIVATQYGFHATGLTAGDPCAGFFGEIVAATGRWNFYAAGTANNAFASNTRFGGVTVPTVAVDVTGSILASVEVKATTVWASGADANILTVGTGTVLGGSVKDGVTVTSWPNLNPTEEPFYELAITCLSDDFNSLNQLTFNTGLGTFGAPATVSSTTALGTIQAKGYNVTGFSNVAAIDFAVDGAKATYIPGKIVFRLNSGANSNLRPLVVDSTGLTVRSQFAVAAGSTTQSFIKAGSTADFGIFFGTGAPTFTAVANSLYIRRDGSTTITRLYVNTTGSTTWATVATSA